MPNVVKTTGIVLKSSKHTIDAAKLLDIFSPEIGRFSAVIRGVEKPKAKNALASQPFCFGEFMLAEKNGYYTVLECSVYDSFFELAYNLDAYVLGSSLLEITSKFALAGEENLGLFKLLINSLKILTYENADPTAVAIKYIMEILRVSGFGFDILNCAVCGKSVANESKVGLIYEGTGVVCDKDKNKLAHVDLSQAEWGILKNIAKTSIDKMAGLKFSSREGLSACLKLAHKQFYYRTGEKIVSLEPYLKDW